MWDERYNTDAYFYGTQANDFLRTHFREVPAGGRILCLAEGEGRNAVFLAREGYDVTAVDLSRKGLEKAEKLAATYGVAITCIHADLAGFDLGEDQWDGIVSIFCHLPVDIRQTVHQQIPRALKVGGVLLLEAYTPEQIGKGTGGPPDAALMMTRQSLSEELAGLQFKHFQTLQREVIEGSGHTGTGAVIQLIASKRASKYAVSANRDKASQRVRYVESGGGTADDGECRLCTPVVPTDPEKGQ